jgi:hypothetical protein
MGIYRDTYYWTFNRFSTTSFRGASVLAVNRQDMLDGVGSPRAVQFLTSYASLLPADVDSTEQPPSPGPQGIMLSVRPYLYMWKVGPPSIYIVMQAFIQACVNMKTYTHPLSFPTRTPEQINLDWNNPSAATMSGPTTIVPATFNQPCPGATGCVPQPGTNRLLDVLGDRLMFRFAYRKFPTYDSAVVVHSVNAVSSGTKAGVRWYELRNLASGTTFIHQQGTYAPDEKWRWMGSIAMDRVGNIAMGEGIHHGSMREDSTRCKNSDPASFLHSIPTIRLLHLEHLCVPVHWDHGPTGCGHARRHDAGRDRRPSWWRLAVEF